MSTAAQFLAEQDEGELNCASPDEVGERLASVGCKLSADYKRCMETGLAAIGNTVGILECNSAEIERHDAQLNTIYSATLARLNTAQKSMLRASERAWIKQRDARCDEEAAPEEGGSLAKIIYSECILIETIKRTIWLDSYKP